MQDLTHKKVLLLQAEKTLSPRCIATTLSCILCPLRRTQVLIKCGSYCSFHQTICWSAQSERTDDSPDGGSACALTEWVNNNSSNLPDTAGRIKAITPVRMFHWEVAGLSWFRRKNLKFTEWKFQGNCFLYTTQVNLGYSFEGVDSCRYQWLLVFSATAKKI